MAPLTVAVAGGSGYLGKQVVEALLSASVHPEQIGRVVVLTRNPTSATCKEIEAKGAVIRGGVVDASVLQGVDVLVNAIGGQDIKLEDHNRLVEAAAGAGVKVYFTSQWGVDHRSVDLEHPRYQEIAKADVFARSAGGDKMKVVAVHSGSFMEKFFFAAPLLGWDYKTGNYSVIGSPKVKVSAASVADIAKSVTQLAILAAREPSLVPDHLRLSGDAISAENFAQMVFKIIGQPFEINTEDIVAFKTSLVNGGSFIAYARWMIGAGFSDQSHDNSNELFNPAQSLWKWKTFEGYAEETLGKAE